MALSTSAPRPVFLRCSLRIGIWDGLTPPTQYSDRINFTSVELTVPEQETVESRSNMIEDYGTVLDAQNLPTEGGSVAMEFEGFTPDLLRIVLGADLTSGSQTATPVIGEAITTVLDLWVPLANQHLDDAVQPSLDIGGAVTADKYEVDYVAGFVKAIHADAVGTGTIGYTPSAVSWDSYDGGQAKDNYLQLIGKAQDKFTGKIGTLNIRKANLAPSSPFNPVDGSYLNGALEGKLIKPDGAPSPWSWRPLQ